VVTGDRAEVPEGRRCEGVVSGGDRDGLIGVGVRGGVEIGAVPGDRVEVVALELDR
jgi:hypothetical protein